MGFERSLAQFILFFFSFFQNFHGFEKVGEESKEVFNNLLIFSEELELGLQEDGFTELFAMQYEKLTMKELIYYNTNKKIWLNWRPRERSKRNKKKVNELKNQRYS